MLKFICYFFFIITLFICCDKKVHEKKSLVKQTYQNIENTKKSNNRFFKIYKYLISGSPYVIKFVKKDTLHLSYKKKIEYITIENISKRNLWVIS
ncbi:hypothetical protein, partial [Aquimarina sp. BL5]